MIQAENKFVNAAIGSNETILQDIHIKSKNIAVYQRDITTLSPELERISEYAVECRATGTMEEILSILDDYFTNHLPEAPALLKDISELLDVFKQTTDSPSFRLLLATVNTNMCRKFHTDVNDLRMLCTYIGPGTHWVPNEGVNQKALQLRGSNQEIVKDPQQIQRVQTGDVVILKGALYPEANPILHRSPPIEKTKEKRLLLRIDTNEFLNFLS